ncbi:MAG: hypothetical protein EXS05_00155 [Planctomycetaceae bacterium]|nr:hypothetical protein [Planctomycetaceae bacterium]
MMKLLSTAILGVSATLGGTNVVQACGGGGCCWRACAPAACCAAPAACAPVYGVPADAPAMPGHDMEQAPVPAPASTARLDNGRTTYRSFSFDPGTSTSPGTVLQSPVNRNPVYQAPMMRRGAPSRSYQFGADRKIRGAY